MMEEEVEIKKQGGAGRGRTDRQEGEYGFKKVVQVRRIMAGAGGPPARTCWPATPGGVSS